MKMLSCLLAISCFGLVGCQQSAPPVEQIAVAVEQTSPVAATPTFKPTPTAIIPARNAPPKGKVLLVPQKVESLAGEVRWRWFIYADPKWTPDDFIMSTNGNEKSGLSVAELAHCIHDGASNGKVSVYEYAVTLKVSNEDGGLVTLHNENTLGNKERERLNRTESADWGLRPFDIQQSAKILVPKEQVFSLPFDKTMLEVTAEKADGTPFKQVFRFKAPK